MEEQHEISMYVKDKCLDMWDIYNTRSEDLLDMDFLDMIGYVEDNWSRQSCIDYHMGNIYGDNSGTISWALKVCTSKISMIKQRVEHYVPFDAEEMETELNYIKKIVISEGKDELILAYITQDYEYWDSLTDEELKQI